MSEKSLKNSDANFRLYNTSFASTMALTSTHFSYIPTPISSLISDPSSYNLKSGWFSGRILWSTAAAGSYWGLNNQSLNAA